LILKEEAPREEDAGTGLKFAPTNVTASVLKTGRPATDFIASLCSEKGLEAAKAPENVAKSMSLYFSALQAHLLKTTYSRIPTQ
jgi:hypothetical protein